MERHQFTVILEPEEDGGYHAFCPLLKGCHTQGDTLEEAFANIEEAIGLYLDSLIAHGAPVPRENFVIKPVEVSV